MYEFGRQSDNLRQIQLTVHGTEKPGLIETNVGPNGEDACRGDSGEVSNETLILFDQSPAKTIYIFSYIFQKLMTMILVRRAIAEERQKRAV